MLSLSCLLFVLLTLCALPLVESQLAAAQAYAPTVGPCPPVFTLVRDAGAAGLQSLSSFEESYVASRKSLVLPSAWKTYLTTVQSAADSQNVTLPSYVSDILSGLDNSSYPTLGIATSGGGYRAVIVGAGVLNALDGRNSSAVAAGTGGLLQGSAYLTSLSGGSWLVTSLAQADFPTIYDLVFGPETTTEGGFGGWLVDLSLEMPSDDLAPDLLYWAELVGEITGKLYEGFPVTLSDILARIVSRHFVNGTTVDNFYDPFVTHGAGITFSSFANTSTFESYGQPIPILVTDSLSANGNNTTFFDWKNISVPLTNPVYELNVYEMGSFDPTLSAFVPMKYFGSTNDSACVTDFDQASFISAISGSIFNTFNLTSVLPVSIQSLLTDSGISLETLETAQVPNPFYHVASETFIDTNETLLTLVDGGEDGMNIPLVPLLAKPRGIDVIIAVDIAADTEDNWAGGSTIVATQQYVSYFPDAYAFPPVPDNVSIFLDEGLTLHPTFFGCDSSTDVPLLIYIANGGPPLGQVPYTNTSADQLVYEINETEVILSQSFDIATEGIAVAIDGVWEKDPEWPACLACAVVDRARERAGIERSGICTTCLERYCWS